MESQTKLVAQPIKLVTLVGMVRRLMELAL